MIVAPVPFAVFAFCGGLYMPWDDLVDYKGPARHTSRTRFTWCSIPGRLLGMIVCSIVFGIAGFVYGFIMPWTR